MLSINDRLLRADDGTRIAYRVEGSGPALVLTNGLTTTTTFWKYVRPIWLRRHTVVTWDLPGHGRSGPAASPTAASLEGLPWLLARVMNAAGVERAVQVGWSTGCQVVFETYRQFPQRCDSLVALFGPAGHVLRNTRLPLSGSLIADCFEHLSSRLLAATCRAIELGFRAPWTQSVGHKLGVIGSRAPRPDIDQVLAHMATVDLTTLRQLLLSAEQHSAEPVLPRLRVPLLIVAADRDRFAPPGCVALPMHAAACDSTLVRLPHATHTALLEEPELIASVVENFVSTPHVVTRA